MSAFAVASSFVASTSPEPTSSPSVPTCGQTCVSDFVNYNCGVALDCVRANCDAADQQVLFTFFSGYCDPSASTISSASASATGFPPPSTLATSTVRGTVGASSAASGGVSGASQSTHTPSHHGLSRGATAGIGVGVGLIVLFFIGGLVLFFRRHVQISWKKHKASNVMEIDPVGGAAGGRGTGSAGKNGIIYEVKHVHDEGTNTKMNGNGTAYYEIKHEDEANTVAQPRQTESLSTNVDSGSSTIVTKQEAAVGLVRTEGEEMGTDSNRHEAQGREVPAAQAELRTNANTHEAHGRELPAAQGELSTNANTHEAHGCELPAAQGELSTNAKIYQA